MPHRRPHKQVMVVYGESLRKMVAIPKDSSIKASKEKGQKKFSAHLATLSGFPQVEFDPESTQISPDPASDSSTLGKLKGDVTIILWPQKNTSPATETLAQTDSDLRLVRSKLATANLLVEERDRNPKPKKCGKREKKVLTQVPSPYEDHDMSSQIASLTIDYKEMKSDIAEMRSDIAEMKSDIAELKMENTEMKSEIAESRTEITGIKSEIKELRQFILMIAPIYIRVLLDRAREKIVQASGHVSWENFRDSCGTNDDVRVKKMIATTHGLSLSIASFICEFTDVRQDGNEAAHAARRQIEDIRSAVLQKPLGTERRSLEKLYQFVFEEDINSRPLNE